MRGSRATLLAVVKLLASSPLGGVRPQGALWPNWWSPLAGPESSLPRLAGVCSCRHAWRDPCGRERRVWAGVAHLANHTRSRMGATFVFPARGDLSPLRNGCPARLVAPTATHAFERGVLHLLLRISEVPTTLGLALVQVVRSPVAEPGQHCLAESWNVGT